ncbi:MAG: type II/IV secretion system protein, partial [Lentisphaerae bacterium]|nr:type II/IV secretion system protein [Lentisphaerota bacterium]
VPYVNLTLCEIAPDDARLLPEELSRNYCVIPTKKEADRLSVAMADPKEVSTIDDLSMLTGCEIAPLLAWRADIHDAINRFFPDGTVGKEESAEQASASVKDVREEGLDALVESASVTDLVASIVEGAIHAEATDIHLEPQTKDLRVRYRIDGMLYDVMTVPQSIQAPLISRVKILAKMDITQKRAPQDGHFAMLIGEREFDMRIATLPTSLGERLVIRLLNPANLFLGLKQLGLSQDAFEQVERLIHSPNGMILVTGPIGSGKTTTQYAALNQINILTDSIVTIEDPIEYELPGINQVQVDARTDCTFANILRAVLRQDVNKLLVGEIRDRETAAIAVRASVTGHLVFTTLHTRDAVGAITNLVNLDVPRFLIAGSVLAIVNQRLVRKICQNCKEEYSPEERVLRDLGYKGDIPDDLIFARGRGCNACYHTGYRGRTGIFEVLSMTEEIRGLVRGNAPEADIMAAAMTAGGRSLLSDAMRKVKKQITSVDEVARTVMFRN